MMKYVEYGLYGLLGFIVLVTALISIVKLSKRKKNKKDSLAKKADKVDEVKGVRYSTDDDIIDDKGDMNISYVREDIILQPRKMVRVDKKGPIKPGKYTVLSAYQNEETFNIRIGLYVKEYKHGQEIILVEDDEICPTSSTIILR